MMDNNEIVVHRHPTTTTTTTGDLAARNSSGDSGDDTAAVATTSPKSSEDSNKPKKGIVDHHGLEKAGTATATAKDKAENMDAQPPSKEEISRSKDADAFHQGEEVATMRNHLEIQPLPLNNPITITSIPGAHAVVRRSRATTTRSTGNHGIITTSCQQQANNNTHTQDNFESTHYAATLVEELEEGLNVEDVEVFVGVTKIEKERKDKNANGRKRRLGWIILGVLFLFALLAVLVPLLVQGNNQDNSSSNEDSTTKEPPNQIQTSTQNPHYNNKKNDTSSPNEEEPATGEPNLGVHYPPFQEEDLQAEVVAAIQKGEADDPFYKANVWMMNDPNLHLYSPQRQKQRFYLAMMFFATNGETSWTHKDNWLDYNVSECLWYSSSNFSTDSPYHPNQVCDENNTMISLSLAHNNLTGNWPIYYTSFIPDLQIFDIGYNSIGGPFPKVTTASAIEALVFSQNPLTGAPVVSLYGGVGPFDNLKVLKLDDTKIRGGNGGGLFYSTPILIPKLEVLNSTGQTYNAPIYSSLGLLTNLEYVNFGHTEAHGTIPTELGLLHNITFLDLSSLPGLSGSLPSELGQLSKLTYLDLTETPLTGIIPRGLCNSTVQRTLTIMANCDEIDCCT